MSNPADRYWTYVAAPDLRAFPESAQSRRRRNRPRPPTAPEADSVILPRELFAAIEAHLDLGRHGHPTPPELTDRLWHRLQALKGK